MEILLKKDNKPTEEGTYLCREFPSTQVKVLTIHLKGKTLLVKNPIGTWTGGLAIQEIPLTKFGDQLSVWSDKITIRTQLACEVNNP